MKDKIPIIKCLKCGKALALLEELQENPKVFEIDQDSGDRFHNDKNGYYIACRFCGAKNGFVPDNKPGLPGLRLSHLIE